MLSLHPVESEFACLEPKCLNLQIDSHLQSAESSLVREVSEKKCLKMDQISFVGGKNSSKCNKCIRHWSSWLPRTFALLLRHFQFSLFSLILDLWRQRKWMLDQDPGAGTGCAQCFANLDFSGQNVTTTASCSSSAATMLDGLWTLGNF